MLSSTALASLAMAHAAGERGRLERPEQVWGEPAGGGWRPVLEREIEREREVLTGGSIATWHPYQQNQPPKQLNGQI